MTLDPEFADALRRLHRAKDAAYGDAWKRRGEVLSILANIARKVDRLEYSLDGAPATSGETLLDTAVDLLVYCLKYQEYLAGFDPEAARLLSDGTQAQGRNGWVRGPAVTRRPCATRDWRRAGCRGCPRRGREVRGAGSLLCRPLRQPESHRAGRSCPGAHQRGNHADWRPALRASAGLCRVHHVMPGKE